MKIYCIEYEISHQAGADASPPLPSPLGVRKKKALRRGEDEDNNRNIYAIEMC
jgi:hypothetical protein